jgi:hypothetical protein
LREDKERMGAEGVSELSKLREENVKLRSAVTDLQVRLKQSESDKIQLQTSYEQALQALADSEAKRETSDKEMKLAQNQMSSMWKQLESLHKSLDGGSEAPPTGTSLVNERSLQLQCTLCREKISAPPVPSASSLESSPDSSPQPVARQRRGSWLFGRRQRMQDLEAHSKTCSSPQSSPSKSRSRKMKTQSPSVATPAPVQQNELETEYLIVSVTRSPPGTTDLSPFKIITKTNLSQFPATNFEVNRSQTDFQWLYDVLQDACPERIVPPLRPPISLDATISEFQRFLSRIATHKTLRNHHLFIVFLSGKSEEMRSVKAKYRPPHHGDQVQYKPAVGRDTNSGPLVATKEYLTTLEQNLLGLATHLEQSMRRKTSSERTAHWFRAISECEPGDTYLKTAACDLARTCDTMETNHGDSEDTLLIHNLQSIADYVRTALDLLMRVEAAVDKYLYWDEEVTLIEAITAETGTTIPDHPVKADSPTDDSVYDDSGVSDVTSSSEQSAGRRLDHVTSHMSSHMTADEALLTEDATSSEKWALASKYCADAKDYLEMMCRDLSSELNQFDLQKELELKQILMDYAARQLERHEKCQGKWFAMKFLLDTVVTPDNRAVEFSKQQSSPGSHEDMPTISEGKATS